MKIQRNRFTRRNTLLLGMPILALLLAVGVYGYYQWSHSTKTATDTAGYNKVDYNPPTDGQTQAGKDIKNDSVNNPSGKPPAPGTDENVQPSPSDGTVPVTITAANQNGSTLNIRSLIGAVTSTGTCTLTLTKGSAVVTKTSDIQALASSSTCKGFDIPTSDLSTGQWHIQLTVSIDNKTGTATKDITIQ